mmetsp:Transcript_21800/g.30066  ORF Transcript_21800/g.30066 Transcript_21800/m.30066 type:complete len:173 (-) Transcript_21800:48-566(-)
MGHGHGVWAAQGADLQGKVSLAAAVAGEVLCAVALWLVSSRWRTDTQPAWTQAAIPTGRTELQEGPRHSGALPALCPLPSSIVSHVVAIPLALRLASTRDAGAGLAVAGLAVAADLAVVGLRGLRAESATPPPGWQGSASSRWRTAHRSPTRGSGVVIPSLSGVAIAQRAAR